MTHLGKDEKEEGVKAMAIKSLILAEKEKDFTKEDIQRVDSRSGSPSSVPLSHNEQQKKQKIMQKLCLKAIQLIMKVALLLSLATFFA